MSVNKVNSDGSLSRVAGGTLYADAPIGAISPFGGSNVPSGYLLCNGQAVSRTNYAELFAVIGTAFGTGDGSTTFNIPDLREAVPKGAGLNAKGASHYDNDGIALGEFIDDRFQGHYHEFTPIDDYSRGRYDSSGNTDVISEPSSIKPRTLYDRIKQPITGTNGAVRYGATTEVKAVGVNYIIKAKQVAVPFDVAEYIRNQNVLSDIETISLSNTSVTMQYDGIINGIRTATGQCTITVNGNTVAVSSLGASGFGNSFSIPFNKGDIVATSNDVNVVTVRYYKLRDYSGR